MNGKRLFIRPEEVETYIPGGHTGTVNRRLIGEDTVGAKNFEVVLGELNVGGAAHRHSHPDLEHGYYVLEGRCQIEVGEERQEVGPGMAVFVPPGVEHELNVIEPLKVLVFYSPPLNRVQQ
ncbi:MAG: cupin domain-containing protein [Firmicutes bacterium]|nr:cupin domain-containing protein [Bacillota bacterium]